MNYFKINLISGDNKVDITCIGRREEGLVNKLNRVNGQSKLISYHSMVPCLTTSEPRPSGIHPSH